jgi:hypothetical protein
LSEDSLKAFEEGMLNPYETSAASLSLIRFLTTRRSDFKLSVKLNSAEKELHVEVLQEKEGEFLNYFFKLFT